MENPGLYFYLQAMANRLQVPCKSQEATALGGDGCKGVDQNAAIQTVPNSVLADGVD